MPRAHSPDVGVLGRRPSAVSRYFYRLVAHRVYQYHGSSQKGFPTAALHRDRRQALPGPSPSARCTADPAAATVATKQRAPVGTNRPTAAESSVGALPSPSVPNPVHSDRRASRGPPAHEGPDRSPLPTVPGYRCSKRTESIRSNAGAAAKAIPEESVRVGRLARSRRLPPTGAAGDRPSISTPAGRTYRPSPLRKRAAGRRNSQVFGSVHVTSILLLPFRPNLSSPEDSRGNFPRIPRFSPSPEPLAGKPLRAIATTSHRESFQNSRFRLLTGVRNYG